MPQSKKSTSGMGSIRKITKVVKGKEYTFYETRYTVGFDPGTGKQIQRSISGKSKKEVAQKLKETLYSLDKGDYVEPCKMTLGEWLDKWSENYLGSVKPATVCAYKCTIKTHLKPALGAVKLNALDTHIIQNFYNSLTSSQKQEKISYPQDGQKYQWRASQSLTTSSFQRLHANQSNRRLRSTSRREETNQTDG